MSPIVDRLLIVEDDPAQAVLFRAHLERENVYEVDAVDCLSGARRHLAEHPTSLVLCDYRLPDGEGTSLLNGHNGRGRPPIVMLTAAGDEAVAVSAMKSGALDYVVKTPECFAELPRRVEHWLREAREIERRLAVEERLRLIESAFDHTYEAIVITDALIDPPGPRIRYVNPAFTQMTGYSRDEALGRSPRFLQGPATDRDVLNRVRTALSQGEPFEGQVVNYRKSGEEFVVEWRLNPVMEGNRVCNWVAVIRDVTERTRNRARLLELEDRAGQLSRQNTMGEVAEHIAHELNQPLAAIANYAGACARRLASPDFDVKCELETLEKVAEQAVRAGELIRNVRRLVERSESHHRPCDVPTIVRNCRDLVLPTVTMRGSRLSIEVDDDLPEVVCDEMQIGQVLANLVVNSVEWATGVEISMTAARSGKYVEFAVADNGPGIFPQDRERLFEPYYTTKKDGLGMGLAICRSIVLAHRGTIVAEPGEARGLVVRFRLPM